MSVIYDALKKVAKETQKNPGFTKTIGGIKNIQFTYQMAAAVIILLAGVVSFFTVFVGTGKKAGQEVSLKKKAVRQSDDNTGDRVFYQKAQMLSRRLKKQYCLQGIVYDGNESFAIINGRRTALGQQVKSARVTDISVGGVEIETAGGKFFIPLE